MKSSSRSFSLSNSRTFAVCNSFTLVRNFSLTQIITTASKYGIYKRRVRVKANNGKIANGQLWTVSEKYKY